MKKKIAVPVDNQGILDAHFGHCKFFSLIVVEGNSIVSEEKVIPPPHEPGVLPKWLAAQGATDIIAGGMGQRAIQIFLSNDINVYVGAPLGTPMALVEGFLSGNMSFSANYCDH